MPSQSFSTPRTYRITSRCSTSSFAFSAAEHRALQAVDAGVIERVYTLTGNILRTKLGNRPNSGKTLWRLFNAGLFEDGPTMQIASRIYCKQVLTDAGRKALAESQ